MDALDVLETIEKTESADAHSWRKSLTNAELIRLFPARIETPFGTARLKDVLAELKPEPQDLRECLLNPELFYAFAGSCLHSCTILTAGQAITVDEYNSFNSTETKS